MKILMVLTSHSALGDTGKKTGFWIEEFAAPYYVLVDAGATVTIASPKGGQPPVDPKSEEPEAQTAATKRFFADKQAIELVANSVKLNSVHHADYDAVFYPGGHGPLWDLVNDTHSIALIEGFYDTQKPISFVCHAPAALINTKAENGEPLVKGKRLTAFSNTEEEEVGLTGIVPFSLEYELLKNGAQYFKANNWSSFTEQDGLLITGQNPASSEAVAELLLKTLNGNQ
ncbi:MAG: type 1 glutamine amidotransferase domain-containing protein [Sphingobacteriia bacterium 35-40-5]|nr:MAG: type 1 glutamine amidotransferase domain-containing protein [Sphingobacteriia bacterium 35-40-5]HQR94836.1 type 1 glutamine amidotransferase domain-containing protein [Sediminibacterium sp.]